MSKTIEKAKDIMARRGRSKRRKRGYKLLSKGGQISGSSPVHDARGRDRGSRK